MIRKTILIFWVIAFSGCSFAKDNKELGTEAVNSGQYAEAYKLWLPLAKKGDPEVQEAIALLLISDSDLGIQLSTNEREESALEWVTLSAKSGHKSAMKWIGQTLKNGWHGVKKDENKANCWLDASDGKRSVIDCEF